MDKNKNGENQQSSNQGGNPNRGMDEFEQTTGSKGGQVGGNRERANSHKGQGGAVGENGDLSDASDVNGDNLDEF